MNISEAAAQSGLVPRTIRYYEQIELITSARRSDNGYRVYSQRDLAELRFVHRARDVGFSVGECRQLLNIHRNSQRQSHQVKSLVLEKTRQISERISKLEAMRTSLQILARRCQGDEGPDCAILDELGKAGTSA